VNWVIATHPLLCGTADSVADNMLEWFKLHCSLRPEGAYSVYSEICSSLRQVRASPTGAQYVTSDSTIYCEKVKMCRFMSGNWFFGTKLVQLAVAVKKLQHNCAPPKKIVIICTLLRLSISDSSIQSDILSTGGDALILYKVPTRIYRASLILVSCNRGSKVIPTRSQFQRNWG
jgi:hypothetical protein